MKRKTEYLTALANECDTSNGLYRCNHLEALIVQAYLHYQQEMCAMGNDDKKENMESIVSVIRNGETEVKTRNRMLNKNNTEEFIERHI